MFFEPVRRGNFFKMKVWIAAINSVKFSSKSEPSSRFFGRLKFSESNFCETLNGRLPLEDGSDRRETLPKRVSDNSRRFSTLEQFLVGKNCELRTAIYPPRMAPFSPKLWGNAFHMIPGISFFDVEKKKRQNLSTTIFARICFVLARGHMCPS